MSEEPSAVKEKVVSSGHGRDFLLEANFFQNGCFILISEGERRIGAISVAISTSNKVNVAKVIPSKYDSIFVNSIAEKVSSMINGICLVSLYSKEQLQLDDMKAIMGEIITIVDRKKHDGRKE